MQSILGKHLDRRTLLRGTGAALAIPFLDAMVPALRANEQLSKPPLRSAFIFMPNGVWPKNWFPDGDGEEFELKPMNKCLEKVKENITFVEGLWHKNTLGRNGHWPKVPAYLSGGYVVRTSGADLNTGGVSLDQLLASRTVGQTPLPSLELGVDEAYTGVDNIGGGFARIYGSHIAWRDPTIPVPKEIVPRLAFDRLFRTGVKSAPVSGFTLQNPEVNKSLSGDDTSVLDIVLDDAKSLQKKVGSHDRQKLNEYFDSVRAIEIRIENAMKPQKRWINAGRFDLLRPGPGIPVSHEEHVKLMLDIMVLAFWTDTTRICTFMMGNAQTGRNFSFIDGVTGSFHGLSHHQNEDKTRNQYEKIGTWHMEQYAYLLEKMASLNEGDGTLLDHSMVQWGSTLREGNSHDSHNLPIIVAGKANGHLRAGRRIKYTPDTPLCNLYLTMLRWHGYEDKSFGDSTGTLDKLS